MNMNKTILATLITTVFSSNVLAQKVDVELANLATEKTIQSQMDDIDAATQVELNAQSEEAVELNGVAYEQDDSGVWKAIGGGALGLTAALLSGSSSSSSNGSSDIPDYEQGPILPGVDNKPGQPDVDIDAPRDVYLVSHGDTAHMFVNGEEVRTATLDVTSEGNYTITGSEGATFHVVGNDILVTMVNGESVKLHNVNRTDDRNISFSVGGENYNVHRTYNGEVWVQKEQGNGTGHWATVKTGADVLANIQERQLINVIDKTIPEVDGSPIEPDLKWADYDNDNIINRLEFTQDKKALEALAKGAGFEMMGDYLDWQSGFSGIPVDKKNDMAFTMLTGGDLTIKQVILMNNLTLNGDVSMLQTLMNDAYVHSGSWDTVTNAINAAYGRDLDTQQLIDFAARNQDALSVERNAKAIRLLMTIEANGTEWVKDQIRTEIDDRIDIGGDREQITLDSLSSVQVNKLQALKAKLSPAQINKLNTRFNK
ncbi:hypothetical protein L4C33_18040 [Vibrio makurazakiensis]|uniref:hypothetical protein n=1 Tax=Vibrio makurazakiensis TaxID=2910250 RepID=UPI003D13BBE6